MLNFKIYSTNVINLRFIRIIIVNYLHVPNYSVTFAPTKRKQLIINILNSKTMDYGKQKIYKGNGITAYLTRLKPWYKGQPDRWIVTYYAQNGSGKSSGLKDFSNEEEAQEFIMTKII